jgi:hypothetical protein
MDRPLLAPWLGDHLGRLRLLLPDGSMALSVGAGDRLCKIHEIELTSQSPRHQRLTLVLEPMLRVTGVVKNQNGLPVPGVQLSPTFSGIGNIDLSRTVFNACLDRNLHGLSGTTDADGRFELTYLAQCGVRYRLRATLNADGRLHHNPVALQLGEASVEDAVLELNCPDELVVRTTPRK